MAEPAQEMQIAMRTLWDTGDGADLTLVCRGKEWKVHSSYLWPRSSWFKAACRGGFKVSRCDSAPVNNTDLWCRRTQRIEFPEEEPSMIYRMLQHLYLQTYAVNLGHDPFWSINDSWATTRLHVHAQMYGLGDKYDLPSLKKEAARRFGEDVKIPGHSKRETLTLLSVVQTVCETTPDSDRDLRDLVVQQIFQRYSKASKHFVEELDDALEVRQFARDIIVLHRKSPPFDYKTIARGAYRIWHRHVSPLLAATNSYFRNVAHLHARLHARILATGRTPGKMICVLVTVLVLISILKKYLAPYTHATTGECQAICHGLDADPIFMPNTRELLSTVITYTMRSGLHLLGIIQWEVCHIKCSLELLSHP